MLPDGFAFNAKAQRREGEETNGFDRKIGDRKIKDGLNHERHETHEKKQAQKKEVNHEWHESHE